MNEIFSVVVAMAGGGISHSFIFQRSTNNNFQIRYSSVLIVPSSANFPSCCRRAIWKIIIKSRKGELYNNSRKKTGLSERGSLHLYSSLVFCCTLWWNTKHNSQQLKAEHSFFVPICKFSKSAQKRHETTTGIFVLFFIIFRAIAKEKKITQNAREIKTKRPQAKRKKIFFLCMLLCFRGVN